MPMSGYPMHPGMTPQQQQMMQQRMQAPQPNAGGMSTPTPPRTFQSQPQGTPTPTNVPSSQPPQIPTPHHPQAQAAPQARTPNNGQQPSQHHPPPNNIQTPQTPTFPSSVQGNTTNGASSGATPLSPGGDSKDKERFALILEINNELLLEAMQIQQTQQALKKERTLPNGNNDGAASNGSDNKPTEEEELLGLDYIQWVSTTYLP